VGLADGTALPVRDAVADVVVSSMVLMDVPDLDTHLVELARVLRPGGSLVVALLHPLAVSGFFLDDGHGTFAMGNYLREQMHDWVSERNGRSIAYRFWQRPLSTYLSAIGAAGLGVVEAREPSPPRQLVDRMPDMAGWRRVPMFVHLRATKR
jgi:SAM-dependent methyltransferase